MAVEGKRKYVIYLDEANAEYVRSFLKTTPRMGGLSGLLDGYLATMAKTLRASNYVEGKKMTAAKALRVFVNGLKQDPV